ncbi:tRNA (adenosine(37)-N6)-threonylcarbamoyltransferase complex dimerization subunit type 1 TsaB [bacterium CG10_46_32]|nr:MAG: tRNA (adenosine(37)-N6)-threonylcarbamoyltransferase complex dimerization subunit type 1 TsaB [bacterium CG10_46_32]PIR55664.1 MAG: tRNA (adenosine(37)-N6)-threonylcarbamoyltransferase complex dimerization subunit type 1 TsaB [Parcubacteria group bacterium CG10_big_fil_rev_8_21_14_0_10_46_32]
MYLYINTTERDSFELALIGESKLIKKKIVKSNRQHSEKLLKSIQALLKSGTSSLADIKGVAAVKGPGSFVSLRIGISTANALAYALQVPIVGVSQEKGIDEIAQLFKRLTSFTKIITPEYGREPDMVMKKRD